MDSILPEIVVSSLWAWSKTGNGSRCVKWQVVFQDLFLKGSRPGKTKVVKTSTAIQILKNLTERTSFFTFQILASDIVGSGSDLAKLLSDVYCYAGHPWKKNYLHFPWVPPGHLPLTKEPKDCGYKREPANFLIQLMLLMIYLLQQGSHWFTYSRVSCRLALCSWCVG